MKHFDFEKPIEDLQKKIDKLKELSSDGELNLNKDIQKIESKITAIRESIYQQLTPSQVIQIARHPNRPDTLSYCQLILDDFIQLHGDRQFKDDPSIVGGIGQLDCFRVMIIGHQKGHTTKENIYRNFGMPNPEGYRKALRLMQLANKFNMPIITLIDTPGAYPGIEAEQRGQAEAIARNLRDMMGLRVPIVSIVIGEGGSGGALGIGMCNRLFMLEYAVYSVISPEGCASILFRDASLASKAAQLLKLTAKEIKGLGIADQILPEPLGGAHNNWKEMATSIQWALLCALKEYATLSAEDIVEQRYQKFRQMGIFTQTSDH